MRIALLMTVVGSLTFALWMTIRWYKKEWPGAPVGSLVQSHTSAASFAVTEMSSLDKEYWAFINEWNLKGQADDRAPMMRSVADSSGTPSGRRAVARRSHQLNYKKWSKQRHD